MIFQDVRYVLQVEICKLRLDEGPLGDHHFVLMALTLGQESFRDGKVNPVLWLLRQGVLVGDSDFVVGEYLIEILLSALWVVVDET